MPTNFIVQKFEPGFNLKSLRIIIEDVDSTTPEITFSEWFEGNIRQKKKEREKSARLVVKLAAEDESSMFDLDSCAQEVDASTPNYYNLLESQTYVEKNFKNFYVNQKVKSKSDHKIKTIKILAMNKVGRSAPQKDTMQISNSVSPLEYSLKKVKENNARIMENIQMLNRTLSYTKQKEFELVCPKALKSYPCDICGKGFVYETGLKRHYALRHAAAAAAPRWQVVWTCAECYQVWPRAAAAAAHAARCCQPPRPECTREIKTSSLLQCEFCEKVFTSIPRMLRHTKQHTSTNNYECRACELGFASWRAADQHWLTCPWQKAHSFALPKLFLCNACDRKFRNYDQLYNHRYKVGHFMSKLHGDAAGAGFVYQCELCGHCQPSILALHVHRNQHHSRYDLHNQMEAVNNSFGPR